MNTAKKQVTWTEIDTTDDTDGGNDNGDVKIDVIIKDKKGQASNERRAPVHKDEETENFENDTETSENQEDGEVRQETARETEQLKDSQGTKREGRAHKRIQTLIGRLGEKDQYITNLENKLLELSARSRQVESSNVKAHAAQFKELIAAKQAALEEAVDKSQGKDIARLTQEIADATMKYNAYQAVAEESEDTQQQEEPRHQQNQRNTQREQPPEVPDAAREWVSRNPWFRTDQKKHVMARMISQEITNEGILDPNEDEYWTELDKRLKATFNEKPQETQGVKRPKGSPVGSRSDEDSESTSRVNSQFSRTGNKVQAFATRGDEEMAERLNIPIKDYMREKYKYAQQDFKGYVTIDIPNS